MNTCSPRAAFLQSVGCCYMSMTKLFPLSQGLDDCSFSYVARELSCHALETYCQRLVEADGGQKLKIHCYRALLEALMLKKGSPHMRAG